MSGMENINNLRDCACNFHVTCDAFEWAACILGQPKLALDPKLERVAGRTEHITGKTEQSRVGQDRAANAGQLRRKPLEKLPGLRRRVCFAPERASSPDGIIGILLMIY